MGLLKNVVLVPVVMACATIGTIGMILGIGKIFHRTTAQSERKE